MQETITSIKTSDNFDKPNLTAVEGGDLSLKVEWRSDGKLWASLNGRESVVRVSRCFPWSEPHRYVSLRDDDENEVALIDKLSDLDADSRLAVEKALTEAGFVLEVVGVKAIIEDFEIRSWQVLTRQGPRKFQTLLDDWPLVVSGGGLLIRDIAGDLFYIDDPDAMDEHSRKLLWAFIG